MDNQLFEYEIEQISPKQWIAFVKGDRTKSETSPSEQEAIMKLIGAQASDPTQFFVAYFKALGAEGYGTRLSSLLKEAIYDYYHYTPGPHKHLRKELYKIAEHCARNRPHPRRPAKSL